MTLAAALLIASDATACRHCGAVGRIDGHGFAAGPDGAWSACAGCGRLISFEADDPADTISLWAVDGGEICRRIGHRVVAHVTLDPVAPKAILAAHCACCGASSRRPHQPDFFAANDH